MAISAITLAELSAGPHQVRSNDEQDHYGAPTELARRLDVLQRAEHEFDPIPFGVEAARTYGRVTAGVVAAGRKPTPSGRRPDDRGNGHRRRAAAVHDESCRLRRATRHAHHRSGHSSSHARRASLRQPRPAPLTRLAVPGGVGKTGSPADFTSLVDDVEQRIFGQRRRDVGYPGHGDDTTLAVDRGNIGEWRERGW
jgi:hypothetical protein